MRHEQVVDGPSEIEDGHGLVLQVVVQVVALMQVQVIDGEAIRSFRHQIVIYKFFFTAEQWAEQRVLQEVDALLS